MLIQSLLGSELLVPPDASTPRMPHILAAGYSTDVSQSQFEMWLPCPKSPTIHDPDALPRQRFQHRNPEGWPKRQQPRSGEDHLGAHQEELPPPGPRTAAHCLPCHRWKRPGRDWDFQWRCLPGKIDHGPRPGGQRGHLGL